MKVLKFSTDIKASREKVWEVLWNEDTYKQWTKVFGEGSTTKSDWNEGDPIAFLDSKGNGMQSKINKKLPPETMVFQHLKVIKDGDVQPTTPESKQWEGALESYNLSENNGTTTLLVKMDSAKEYEDFFEENFPKALEIIKQMAENNKM